MRSATVGVASFLLLIGLTAPTMAEPPRLVRSVPANGSTDIPVGVGKLLFEFDQPMGGDYTFGRVGRLSFPPLQEEFAQWTDRRTFALRVQRLRPDTTYAVQLNTEARAGFASAAGEALPVTAITFTTGKAKGPGYRIINLIPDFIHYHEQARDRNLAGRVHRWNTLLEAKHPAFFNDSIYRALQGAERERYKMSCIRRFWAEMPPLLPKLGAMHRGVERQLRATIETFRSTFPDFNPSRDYYLTIAFSYRGKVMGVGGKDAFALGLEQLADGGPQVPITIAHELFHLYHFQTFDCGWGLYRTLWAEGMAVYASAVLVPGHAMSAYLQFPPEKMNRCEQLLPTLAKGLKEHLGSGQRRVKRLYFGAEANDAGIPPEAGYYVGLLIVQRLARESSLAKLARLRPSAVYPILERELDRLANQP
jgi:hypothetical protein